MYKQNVLEGDIHMNILNKSGLTLARETAGLDIVELAAKLKVEVSVIRGWEAGGGVIPLNTVIKLIKILNTSAEMILFGENRQGLNIELLTNEQREIIMKLYDMMKNNK